MARQRRGGFRPPELRGTLGTLLRTTLAQATGLAREGRARLDDALAGRRRTDALAELGELVLDLIRRGEIELDQLPEARELVAHLDELDHAEEEPADYAPAPSRSRFDDRGPASPTNKDDGTVSSARWAAPKKPAARVWKPIEESERHVEPPPPVQKKLGGISFGKDEDDDSDLAEFMHPDDVPPKAK